MRHSSDRRSEISLHNDMRPELLLLGPNLHAVSFRTMKLIPAWHIVDQAIRTGVLTQGAPIVETTSGTMGKGLAYVGRALGISVILVSDPVLDEPLRNELLSLKCRLHIVQASPDSGNVQLRRLEMVETILEQNPGAYWTRQYDNPWNADSYGSVAEQIADQVGRVDCLVATVGSGGSSSGCASYLRRFFPELRLIGCDTHGSVIFGQPERKRIFRGLGNSLVPMNVQHCASDDVHWIEAADAYAATRTLHRNHGLFKGPTSGAAFWISKWYAEQHPDEVVVALLPDDGQRYATTVYSDAWLAAQGLAVQGIAGEPVTISYPHERMQGWTRFDWRRRNLPDVLSLAADAS